MQRADFLILIVDDDPVIRQLSVKQLARLGFDATAVCNGKEAVSAFESNGAFKLILMDLQMPEMGGLEATSRIRAFEQDHNRAPIPIIAVTAGAVNVDEQTCLSKGMSAYVEKPLSLIDMGKLLSTWIK